MSVDRGAVPNSGPRLAAFRLVQGGSRFRGVWPGIWERDLEEAGTPAGVQAGRRSGIQNDLDSEIPKVRGGDVRALVCDPVFHDPAGEKLRG